MRIYWADKLNDVRQMARQGATVKCLAKHYGTSGQSILSMLHNHNIRLRELRAR